MLYQNPDSEYMVIVVILLIAIFVFVIVLIATFALLRSEARTNKEIGLKDEVKPSLPVAVLDTLPEYKPIKEVRPKDELKSSSPATGFATFFREDGFKNPLKSSQRAILEKSPKGIKTLNWVACLIIATYVAWSNYWRVGSIVGNTSLNIYFILLGIISPTCLAVVWLRLTGLEWRQTLRLFIWVPVALGGTLLIWLIVALFFFPRY